MKSIRLSVRQTLGECLLLFAFAISLYLTAWRPDILSGNAICALRSSCDVVITSGLSRLAGVPTSLLGMVVAGVLFISSTIGLVATGKVALFSFKFLFTSTVLMSVFLQGYSALILHAFCPYCFGFFLYILASFACLVLGNPSFRQDRKFVEYLPLASTGFICSMFFLLFPKSGLREESVDLVAFKRVRESGQVPEPILRLNQGGAIRIFIFVNPSCGHCKERVPALIKAVSKKRAIELNFYWNLGPRGDVELVTLGAASFPRRAADEILFAILSSEGVGIDRERDFRKRLNLENEDSIFDSQMRRSTLGIIDAQRKFSQQINLGGTPCYVYDDRTNGPSLVSEEWIIARAGS